MRKKKVLDAINDAFTHHNLNTHMFSRPGKVSKENRLQTSSSLNEIVVQILDHLGLVYNDDTKSLVDKSMWQCSGESVEVEGKPVSVIEACGMVHLAAKGADQRLVRNTLAGNLTCPACIKKAKDKGYL